MKMTQNMRVAALGVLGTGESGQSGMELHGHILGVDHGILGAAGVDAETVNGHIFIFNTF